VGYKNHSVGYIFHSVKYKSHTVKQRIFRRISKNMLEAVEKYVGGKRSSLQSEVLAFLSEKHRKCVEKSRNVRRSSENSCIFACIE